jgi:hypothetical protein
VAAGLDPYNARVTRERCLDAIQRVADEIGHPPTSSEYVERAEGDQSLPSMPSITVRFDGFVAAREAALNDIDK